MQEIPRKILYILIVLTILGQALSIYMFAAEIRVNPEMEYGPRDGLVVDWEIAALNAGVMIPLNILALFLIIKRKEWGPIFFITISVGNRIWSQFIYDSGMHGLFISWTILLVFFAYYVYRKMNWTEITSIVAGAVSGFPVFYFVFWETINEIIATAAWVLVIAAWIIAVKLITKKNTNKKLLTK